jgi:hypothetical protein
LWYKVYLEILKDEFKILTGRTFSRNKMARKLSALFWYKVYLEIPRTSLEILKDEFKILTGRTFSRNKMARKLSVFSTLMSNYSFNDNFCQKIIIYLESLYNKLYFDIKFIWKYWKMNSKSWQDGLFHGTKWRENYQCSCVWSRIIVLTLTSVKRWLYIWKACKNSFILIHVHISIFF